ncbi:MAG: RHS repeat-associated core domain-containing protein [Planctomycetota bacterium]
MSANRDKLLISIVGLGEPIQQQRHQLRRDRDNPLFVADVYRTGQRYEYDAENRVVRVLRDSTAYGGGGPAGQVLAEYEYDALGRRIHTIEYIDAETGVAMDGVGGNPPPKKTRHVYVGVETVQEYDVTIEPYPWDEVTTLLREFVWGDSQRFPEPVAMIDWTDAGQSSGTCGTGVPPVGCVYHYLHDTLGSVVGLMNESDALVERYAYEPYGATLMEHEDSGSWTATNGSHFGNPFAWTGQRYDAGVDLYGFFARTYSPTLGRWLQRDPLGYVDGVNLYQYVRGNPLFSVDPFGLEGDDDCGDDDEEQTNGGWEDDPANGEHIKLDPKDLCHRECKRAAIRCIKAQAAPPRTCNEDKNRCARYCNQKKKEADKRNDGGEYWEENGAAIGQGFWGPPGHARDPIRGGYYCRSWKYGGYWIGKTRNEIEQYQAAKTMRFRVGAENFFYKGRRWAIRGAVEIGAFLTVGKLKVKKGSALYQTLKKTLQAGDADLAWQVLKTGTVEFFSEAWKDDLVDGIEDLLDP